MTGGGIRLLPFALVSTALHAVVFMGVPERFEMAVSPSGETGPVSVRLLAAGPDSSDPVARTAVAGSVPRLEAPPQPKSDPSEPASESKRPSGAEQRTASLDTDRINPETGTATAPSNQQDAEPKPDTGSELEPESTAKPAPAREPEHEPKPAEAPKPEEKTGGASPETSTAERKTASARDEAPAEPARSQNHETRQTTDEPDRGKADAGKPDEAAGSKGRNARSQLANRARKDVTVRFSEHFRYPRIARRHGWEGRVVLAFRVHSDGRITDVRVIESSGREILDESARETLNRIERIPELTNRLDDGPLELEVPVTYRLQPA